MRRQRALLRAFAAAAVIWCSAFGLCAGETVEHPFQGVTLIARTDSVPRQLAIHIVRVNLTAPGIAFKLTPPGGKLETVRQTTLDFLNQERAQIVVNAHFFLPFPSASVDADLIGLAASNGAVYSAFETPAQSYAIVDHAPALNIDRANRAGIVHCDRSYPDGKHVIERATLWNVVAGSAQIVTRGEKTIPSYAGPQNPLGALLPGGPRAYSPANSWYDALQARTVIGLSRDNATLYLVVVDRAAGSLGMRVGEVADLLIRDYGVYDALNLDGGGSTSMAIENRATHSGALVNRSSDNPRGRSVGSNLAVFARRADVAIP